MAPGRFIEVFIDCPLEVCEKRDTKGLYKKARAGMIEGFTGISSPYEPSLVPEVHLKTNNDKVNECIDKIMNYLKNACYF